MGNPVMAVLVPALAEVYKLPLQTQMLCEGWLKQIGPLPEDKHVHRSCVEAA